MILKLQAIRLFTLFFFQKPFLLSMQQAYLSFCSLNRWKVIIVLWLKKFSCKDFLISYWVCKIDPYNFFSCREPRNHPLTFIGGPPCIHTYTSQNYMQNADDNAIVAKHFDTITQHALINPYHQWIKRHNVWWMMMFSYLSTPPLHQIQSA